MKKRILLFFSITMLTVVLLGGCRKDIGASNNSEVLTETEYISETENDVETENAFGTGNMTESEEISDTEYIVTEDEANAHTHKYTADVTEPSCTEEGYTTYICSCGNSYIGDITNACGHVWGTWSNIKKATETATGTDERICSVCKGSETRIVNKVIPNHTHKYTSKIKKASTCTAEGVMTYTCSCGGSYTESIKKLGHDYKTEEKEATCTADGYIKFSCTRCSYVSSTFNIPAMGHSWDSSELIDATCTTGGGWYDICDCGAKKVHWSTEAYGHNYDISGERDGKLMYTCGSCGDNYLEDIVTRYEKTLPVPIIGAVYAEDSSIWIHLDSDIKEEGTFGYQTLISTNQDFSKNVYQSKIHLSQSDNGYGREGFNMSAGYGYYKIRSFYMDGETFVYGPWTTVSKAECANFSTKLNKSSKYTYEIYFVDNLGTDIYTGVYKAVYIKTDNPDMSSMRLMIDGKDECAYVYSMGKDGYYDDVKYLSSYDYGNRLRKVEGGYLGMLDIDDAGTKTMELWEGSLDGYVEAKSVKVNVLDYETERDKWVDEVIATVTNSSMNPKEKMDAVAAYLDNGQFSYLTNVNGSVVVLAAQPNNPCFITKRWDSCTSPAMLAVFGERIGGFEEVHDCYDDYPIGSNEWYNAHYWAYVVYQGEKYYYAVCPLTPTGEIGSVEMIDFTNTSQFKKF